MITQDQLFRFAVEYRENIEKYVELSDKLLCPLGRKEWLALLKERSEITREIFRQNETWLPLIYKDMEQMTPELALALYDALMNVFFDRFRSSDYPLLIDIAEKILPVFEARRDYNRTLRLYAILVYWNNEYYGREMGAEIKGEAIEYAQKVISCKEHYTEISDKETRLRFFRTYANMIGVMPELYDIPAETVISWYQDMIDFWESAPVQALDGEDEVIRAEVEWTRSSFLDYCCAQLMATLPTPGDTPCAVYLEESLDTPEEAAEDDFITRRAKRVVDIVKGRRTPDEVVRLTLAEMQALPDIDFNTRSDEDNLDVFDEMTMSTIFFWNILKIADFCDAEKRELSKTAIRIFLSQARRIPGSAYTDFVNDTYADVLKEALPYLDSFSEKELMLEKLMISRQPLTFVHSCMVEKAAILLGAAVISDAPEILAGVPGFPDKAEVVRKKEEMLTYLGKCGALHDIGKCTIAGVINMQTRKVNEKEFRCIKQHPRRGIHILKDDPDFANYIPVMLGHHRTYDGRGGYPEDYDIVSSPYRPVIHLISICDSLDAATDRYGRNYNRAKNFETVLKELSAGAGSRYDPDIVRVIERNKDLQAALRHLTTDGRAEAYYTAYRKCQELVGI